MIRLRSRRDHEPRLFVWSSIPLVRVENVRYRDGYTSHCVWGEPQYHLGKYDPILKRIVPRY